MALKGSTTSSSPCSCTSERQSSRRSRCLALRRFRGWCGREAWAYLELEQAEVHRVVGGPVVQVHVVLLVELQQPINTQGSVQFFPLIYITWARRWESACTYLDVGDGAGELLGVEHQDGQVTQVAVARVAHLLRSRDRRVSPAPKI